MAAPWPPSATTRPCAVGRHDGQAGKIRVGSPEDPSHASSLDFSADGNSLFVGDSTGQVTCGAPAANVRQRRNPQSGGQSGWRFICRAMGRAWPEPPRTTRFAVDARQRCAPSVAERTSEEPSPFVRHRLECRQHCWLNGPKDTAALVMGRRHGAMVGEIRPRLALYSCRRHFAGDKIGRGQPRRTGQNDLPGQSWSALDRGDPQDPCHWRGMPTD